MTGPRHCSIAAMRHVLPDLPPPVTPRGFRRLAAAARRGAREMRELGDVLFYINGQRMHSIKNVRVGLA